MKEIKMKKWTEKKTKQTQIDNAKYIDVAMPMYNLIEYSDNYSKISRSLWQYYSDDTNDNITQSESFKFKIKITGKTHAAGDTNDVEIAMSLKYLTLEMPLINCEFIYSFVYSLFIFDLQLMK